MQQGMPNRDNVGRILRIYWEILWVYTSGVCSHLILLDFGFLVALALQEISHPVDLDVDGSLLGKSGVSLSKFEQVPTCGSRCKGC